MCRTFKKLPSEIYNEDASLLRLLEIERQGSGGNQQQDEEMEEIFDGE